jgi:hypothetical protein
LRVAARRCWNLQAEPVPYLAKLKELCQAHGLGPERVWYERAIAALASRQPEFTAMRLTCSLSRLPNGKWLATPTGPSTGRVEVMAPTREEALTKMRDELPYRIEWCPCGGAWGDTVALQVREEV